MTADEIRNDRKINLMFATRGLGIGGAEVVIRDLVHSIDRNRFNVSVCCSDTLGPIGEELLDEGVDIFVLPRRADGKVDYLTFLKLREVIQTKHIEIVHSHTANAMLDACLCKLTLPKLRVVHTFHFGNYPHQRRRILWMEGAAARVADRLIAVGEVQRRQIQSVFRLRSAHMTTVWNGVRCAEGAGDPAFRKQAGGGEIVLVGTLANLIEQKGLPELLQVAHLLRRSHPNLRFVIAGEGPLRGRLEQMRGELGLEEIVTFAGYLNNAAARILPTIDIYFQPSLWEAMSIAILEAMAAGKPVVATRVGEAPHTICDGRDGILVDPKDVQGMASSISRLIDDPGLRFCLGDAAARKVAGSFSIEHMARRYEAVYSGMLG